jgi:hypothetical protein
MTCNHWQKAYEGNYNDWGSCNCPTVLEKVIAEKLDEDADIEDIPEEERAIFTDAYFGCFYHNMILDTVVTKLPKL